MSLYEEFIPGQWQDNIDVNDFINLNKKPFFDKPIFLSDHKNSTLSFFTSIKKYMENKENPLENIYIDKRNELIPGLLSNRIDIYDNNNSQNARKTNFLLFNEISTSEMRKALKTELLKMPPSHYDFEFIFPDFRTISLYGTKRIIKDKKNYLKSLEKQYQNNDWVNRRLQLIKELDSIKKIEKLAKFYKINISEPANNLKEVFSFIFISILCFKYENPTKNLTFTQIIPFLDIFIEKEIDNNKITEPEVQELVDHFVLKLNTLFHDEFEITETISYHTITKTTYRFLKSVDKFYLNSFNFNILWNKTITKNFKDFCKEILSENINFNFLNSNFLSNHNNIFINSDISYSKINEEYLFEGGILDLEKLLYLSLNGGKDFKTGYNLINFNSPIDESKINYSSVFSYLKEYISYFINLFIETNNLNISISEINENSFIKNSLMSNISSYNIAFNFINFKKIIEILYNISIGNFELIKDENNLIKKINYTLYDFENYEAVAAHLISFIESEIKRIPLYKGGKATIYISPLEENYFYKKDDKYFNISSNLTSAIFNYNIEFENNKEIFEFVEKWFLSDYGSLKTKKQK